MKICPICAHSNREGVALCERCGSHINHIPNLPTRQLEGFAAERFATVRRGTAHLRPNTRVIITIRDVEENLILTTTDRVVLGRLNKQISRKPDIDLTPYGAYRMGVSSTHAILRREDNTMVILDMGSTNGTFLNGQRLSPNQAYLLHDGDEIRLGHLVAVFQMQRP